MVTSDLSYPVFSRWRRILKLCPVCRSEIRADARLCANCGPGPQLQDGLEVLASDLSVEFDDFSHEFCAALAAHDVRIHGLFDA